jgi:hypothetical protein
MPLWNDEERAAANLKTVLSVAEREEKGIKYFGDNPDCYDHGSGKDDYVMLKDGQFGVSIVHLTVYRKHDLRVEKADCAL